MLFFFTTLITWRRFILTTGVVAALLLAVVSFILPKWYTVSTSIFPPETKAGMPIYAELVQNLSLPLLGPMASGAAPETVYIEMLKSRRICERVIEEFGYSEIYRAEIIEEAIDELRKHTGYDLLDNGLLTVTFEDRDAERAAAVANRMIELLDEFNRDLNVTRASRTREFVGEQLAKRKEDLAAAEMKLKEFQEANQALELGEQLASAMEIVASLTAQAIALESELEILGHYAAKNSDEYARRQMEYNQVLVQLKRLKETAGESDRDLVRSFLPTLQELPELALQMVRLKREVQIEQTVVAMLTTEYEKSRIEEARDTPTVQVLDSAAVPNKRSRPQRKLLVLLGGVIGLGWGALIALFVQTWRDDRDRSSVIRRVLSPIASDFSRVLRRR